MSGDSKYNLLSKDRPHGIFTVQSPVFRPGLSFPLSHPLFDTLGQVHVLLESHIAQTLDSDLVRDFCAISRGEDQPLVRFIYNFRTRIRFHEFGFGSFFRSYFLLVNVLPCIR